MFSPLRLDKTWLEELVIEAIGLDAVKSGSAQGFNFSIDYDLLEHQAHPAFRVKLMVEMTADEKSEYSGFRRIRIVLWGQFTFEAGASEEFRRQATPLNQLAILYGIARGVVANSTGLMPGGAVLLPVTDFHAIVKEKNRLEAETEAVPNKRKRASKRPVPSPDLQL